jgi:hypothetical protein
VAHTRDVWAFGALAVALYGVVTKDRAAAAVP